MKIDLEKSRVIFTPENDSEKVKLTALWKILIDCIGSSRKLVPIGEYVPEKNNLGASFHIEGMDAQESSFVDIKVKTATRVFCMTCNKVLNLEAGESIPICCGKMMEIAD